MKNVIYILSRTWKYEKAIIGILLLQTIIGVATPFISMYLPVVTLKGITGELPIECMWMETISLIVILMVCNIINAYINADFDTHLMNNKIHYLADLFHKNMKLSYAYIESKEGQNRFQYVLRTLTNDAQGVTGLLVCLGTLWSCFCSIVLYTGVIALLEVWVIFVLVTLSAGHLIIINYILKQQHNQKDAWIDVEKKLDYLFSYTRSDRSNKDIKLYSMQKWLKDKLYSMIGERIAWTKRLTKYNLFIGTLDTVLLIIRDGLAYYCIFKGLFSNQLNISEFTFYFGAITGFSAFMMRLSSGFAQASQKSREVEAFYEYMKLPEIGKAEKKLCMNTPRIELKHISFKYQTDGPEILKNINLTVEPGERIALVGENGAGKSTLVKILCGLYTPTEGELLINGEKIAKEELQTYYAVAFQDIHILPMTVGENVAFQQAETKRDEIINCLESVGLGDVFPSTDIPVTKLLSKEGKMLSGGQEQRLILARTLYRLLYQGASILLLDEPTAALDPLAEQEFYQQYKAMTEGRSALFISHRLASTQFCDRILVLKEGEIIEEGTHLQLLKQKGVYAEMFALQSQYYKEA